jgi:hypothetical protein
MYPRPDRRSAWQSALAPFLEAGSRHADLDQRICSQRDELARRTGRRQLQLHGSTSALDARVPGTMTHVRLHLMTPFAA